MCWDESISSALVYVNYGYKIIDLGEGIRYIPLKGLMQWGCIGMKQAHEKHSEKWLKAFLISCLSAVLLSCGGGGGGSSGSAAQQTQASSNLCASIRGVEAIFWDIENGIPRGDLPGGIPTIDSVGGTFISSVNPFLGFTYPANYNANEVLNFGSLGGVVVIRNDNQVLWKEETLSVAGSTNVRAVRDQQINDLRAFFGLQGAGAETLCVEEATAEVTPGTGIIGSKSYIFMRTGNHSLLVGASALTTAGITQLRLRASAGPTAEYERLIENVFLAIEWQMLFGGGTTLADRDGDGVPDIEDVAPDDPNIP